jgi:2-methylcitrate dehydratase PrpD
MAEGTHNAIERLAQHLARPVPASLRDRARLHLLDWLGCVAGAARSEVARAARGGEPDKILRAALLGNVLEMDDVHREALLHPGPVVWPAVLTAIRYKGGDMGALLDAGVRGYEAMIAVGATFDAHHYARWHNTSSAGGIGAAAGAASVYGLDVEQTSWAIGNAASVAGGLWHMRHAPGAMTKQFHIAQAVLAGDAAARLAGASFAGPTGILEGPQGLHAAMTASPKPLRLLPGWRMEGVSFKPWAACRHAHAAIDAALELRARNGLGSAILVETYGDAIRFCDTPHPRTAAEAKFSIQHAVAIVAVRGAPRPEDFEPEAIANADIVAARAQVRLCEAHEFSMAYPAHFGARLTSGDESVTLADARGDPERPLSPDAIVAKARQLVALGGLPFSEAERAAVIALNGEAETRSLFALLESWM